MRIVPYQADHLIDLALQSHQRRLEPSLRDYEWAEQFAERGQCWTALLDDVPVACAGFDEHWEGGAIAWTILGEAGNLHRSALMDEVTNALDHHQAVRVALETLVDFKPSERWPQLMGFVVECVVRRLH